jgi:hypothetical protein
MLFDGLLRPRSRRPTRRQLCAGPKHVVKSGKTPVLEAAEWRTLLDSIPAVTLRDLRWLPDLARPQGRCVV